MPFGAGQLIAAGCRNRAACVLQPAGSELVRLVNRQRDLIIDPPIGGEQPRALELQGERREGVSEHIVHLARKTTALGDARLRGPRLSQHIGLLAQLAHQSQQKEDQYGTDEKRKRSAVPGNQRDGEEHRE